MIDFEQISGKTIAITGATSGIGKETAILLDELGANLVLGARSDEQLRAVASQMKTRPLSISVDVSHEDSVRQFVDQAILNSGKVDAVINCAGTGVVENVLSMSAQDLDRMIAVNLRGTFLCCKYFGQHMAENRAGKILNMISIAGTTALPGCGGYSASKFGVLGLSWVLQAELRDKGVFVSPILPGAVATPFWDTIPNKPDTSQMIPARSLAKHMIYILCQPDGAVVDEVTIMPPLGIL